MSRHDCGDRRAAAGLPHHRLGRGAAPRPLPARGRLGRAWSARPISSSFRSSCSIRWRARTSRHFEIWPLAFALLSALAMMAAILALAAPAARRHRPAIFERLSGRDPLEQLRRHRDAAGALRRDRHHARGRRLRRHRAGRQHAVGDRAHAPCGHRRHRAGRRQRAWRAIRWCWPAASASRPSSSICGFPGPIESTLAVLSEASIALGLFTVGAGLDFGGLRSQPRPASASWRGSSWP